MGGVTRVYSDVFECRQCPEFSEHYKFARDCHGKGNRGLMIVGESAHKPSIEAGRYYDQGSVRTLLAGIVNLDQDCYLSDAIKCDKQFCSAKGKTLDKIAQRCARKYLFQEIALLQPTAIVAVGRIAFEVLTGIAGDFVSRQGDGKRYFAITQNVPVHPVIHPSYANMYYGRVSWQQGISYQQSFVRIVEGCLSKKIEYCVACVTLV